MIRLIFCLLLFSAQSTMAQNTVRLEIRKLPDYHASGSDIFAAGSFNGWNPADPNFRFKKESDGLYYLDLSLPDTAYEFKLTRGGWDNVECLKGGGSSPNRLLKTTTRKTIGLEVQEWADRFPAQPKKSSATAQVQIIDTAFLIPQLKRARRVWVYLPKNYSINAAERFPVLYMHDGQNVFDDATSYSGEWGVDEFLDSTKLAQSIVVAVDHGGNKRLNEYNPYNNEKFGKGEGSAYVDFLVKTLKPYIDKNYRTLTDKKNTAIAGSSMGGLISLYAILKYPAVFGGAGVFSPAFWISGSGIYNDIKKYGKKVNGRIYFYGGKLEGETMVPDMQRAYDELKAISPASVLSIHILEEGKHNEPTWRKEFPAFYEWLHK
jgi:predicted alpha/beta superfamily hydrolase